VRAPDLQIHNTYAIWYVRSDEALEIERENEVWVVRHYRPAHRGAGFVQTTAYVDGPPEMKIERAAEAGWTKIRTFGGEVHRKSALPYLSRARQHLPNPRN